ncbi:MAG: PASTA domain-containing protein, partial [bacterium]|nr:PASTA domain-containing protein [bacterium]
KQEGIEDRRTAFRAPFEAEIAELQKQVLFRETRQAELTAAGVDAFLDDLVTDTHKKFEAAHAALAAVEGSHGLERARLALRFAAGAAGIGAIFPPVDTAVGPARITTLDVDYEPLALAEEAAETPVDTVPSVIGLTRALARRRLVAAGLEAEVYYQAVCVVAGQPSPVGRVVSQLPHAGGAAEPGSTVRLFLGKAS